MRLLLCLCLLLGCTAENSTTVVISQPETTTNPFPYDDFVYGDSFVDEDKDGESSELDCNDENPFVWTGAEESCNGIDDNCDGETDEGGVCP